MSTRNKEWLRYALLIAIIVVAGYFGVRYPLPEMPVEERLQLIEAHLGISDIGLQAVGPTRFRKIQVDHDANVDGDATIGGDATVTGDTSVGGDLAVTGDAAVGGDIAITGDILGNTNIVSKTTSYTLTVAESGSIATNIGASTGLTWTLPSAAAGLNYCYYLAVTQVITISPTATDLIHHLTNSAGDNITGTVLGDTLCLTAIDSVVWVPSNETGSWNDID